MSSRSIISILVILLGILAPTGRAEPPTTIPTEGLRGNQPNVHALAGARIVIEPGRILQEGTLVIRDGLITHVGHQVTVPEDARVWDLHGKTLYPGFIDSYGTLEIGTDTTKKSAGYWNGLIQPERNMSQYLKFDEKLHKTLRSQGVTARLLAPSDGIIKGTSALVSNFDAANPRAIIQDQVALHLRLTTKHGWHHSEYPQSPMGAVALARQAMYDADWYQRAWQSARSSNRLPHPEQNVALAALNEHISGNRLVIVEAPDEQFLLRADQYAREFSLNIAVFGSGHEYRRLSAVQATGRAVILPLNFPKAPFVAHPEASLNVTLEQLMHWDHAPENPGRLAQAGVPIAFSSHGLKDKSDFLSVLRTVVERGLSEDDALRALTTIPAELFGVAGRLGTLNPGMIASLLVTDGDLFDTKTKVLETWVNGQRHEIVDRANEDVRGTWRIQFEEEDPEIPQLNLRLFGTADELEGELKVVEKEPANEEQQPSENESAELQRVRIRNGRFSCTFKGSIVRQQGVIQLSAVLMPPPDPALVGNLVWPDGSRRLFRGVRTDDDSAEENTGDTDTKPGAVAEGENGQQEPLDGDDAGRSTVEPQASFPVNFPLGAFGRSGPPEQPDQVLIQGATVWSCGPDGTLENASVLFGRGKILAVGRDVPIPDGALVIDARGQHVTPGIVDCHSHMATDGGINEATQAITAEVRIGDFIDSRDIAIYHQLAGGVTTANVLHGSANPIGGQNQVIKLRWGGLPEQLKFVEAPPGIKFALGENVKQSNWGDKHTTRYPQTRMGVEQIMRDALQAARDYRSEWERWRRTRQGLPSRVDLEKEALAEVLEGKRWIHCHSYRQDEILALLRTLEDFDVTIGTLQHVLEGYKVADALDQHGAMASAFSDWWAYKFEVYDAIPYNGALMFHAGVNVSFNSDSRELARHLNQEAAKAVKYGEVPPVEALKFVTLNPARQLRIDTYVGSLEPGKHADLVIWNGPPLSNYSRCEQTWIDGRKYFDRGEDVKQRDSIREMHATLIQKILTSDAPMLDPDQIDENSKKSPPREDVFCHPHRHLLGW